MFLLENLQSRQCIVQIQTHNLWRRGHISVQHQAPDEQRLCQRALDTAMAAFVPTALCAQTWSQSTTLITTSMQIKVSTDMNRL